MDSYRVLFRNIPAIICFIGAIIAAIYGSESWGWFLFVGLLVIEGGK